MSSIRFVVTLRHFVVCFVVWSVRCFVSLCHFVSSFRHCVLSFLDCSGLGTRKATIYLSDNMRWLSIICQDGELVRIAERYFAQMQIAELFRVSTKTIR